MLPGNSLPTLLQSNSILRNTWGCYFLCLQDLILRACASQVGDEWISSSLDLVLPTACLLTNLWDDQWHCGAKPPPRGEQRPSGSTFLLIQSPALRLTPANCPTLYRDILSHAGATWSVRLRSLPGADSG